MNRRKIDLTKWGGPGSGKGVACPSCACRQSKVIRTVNGSASILRTRVCRACSAAWETIEKSDLDGPSATGSESS